MVSAISKGRLGNFSFVNMVAYCYSLQNGLDFHIQDRSLALHQWPLYFQHLKNPNWNPNLETVYVNDNQHHYRELEFKEEWRNKNIIIGTEDINTGYFQNYGYLDGYADQIRKAFGFNDEIKEGVIGCHLRYGDYRTLRLFHPPITPSYIYNAMKVFMHNGYDNFRIFSDEIDYAKEQVALAWKEDNEFMPYISFVEGQSELEDFSELISCEGNIVSNSSFSVLAALLSSNKEKEVVCPHEENYFGVENKKLSVATLYPKHWYRIKY